MEQILFGIIYIIFVGVIIFWLFDYKKKENFASNVSMLNPYIVCLHNNISNKENWWHIQHSKKTYNYYNMPLQMLKE